MNTQTGPGDSSGLSVNEIFFSIQGESLYAGRPCVFVRLAGCNLRCVYCDTRYAWSGGREMQIREIVSAVRAYRFPLVEITGGEPLFQKNTPELVKRLLDEKMEVMMETNGTFPIDRIPAGCIKIMDIKCPGSGQSHKTDFDNIGRLGESDQVKFVICDREDYEFARGIIDRYRAGRPAGQVLISPAAGTVKPATVADWILKDRLNVRLQLQLHKILWPDAEKGV
ncbi:MAG: radical SAM protein [Desulfobacteraceae bacterium]|nr:radical SAM protein [Desulfobacteraceae bacterium]MCF8095043.1 radical SAM protein [Desulfobacteraceae bacterium]